MTKYVAFLRGINVGGRVIKMADLAACCEKAGLGSVKTVLQTGNVVFESDKSAPVLKKLLENTLAATFEYPAKVQVIATSKLQKIIAAYPFDSADTESQHYVVFMEDGLETQLLDTAQTDEAIEQVAPGDGVVYWRVQKGMTLKSTFAQNLTKAAYKSFNTNRNLNTLKKITAVRLES